jgi:hypothetical protein
MGFTFTRRLCESVISFERAWDGTEEDLPYFRGTIKCGPRYDPAGQETLDWPGLDDDYEGSVDETRE